MVAVRAAGERAEVHRYHTELVGYPLVVAPAPLRLVHRYRESLLVAGVDILHRGVALRVVDLPAQTQSLGDVVVVRAYPLGQPDHGPLLVDLVVRLRDYVDDQGVVSGPVGPNRVSVEVVGQSYAGGDVVYPAVNAVVAVLLVGPEANRESPPVVELCEPSGSLQHQSYARSVVMCADAGAASGAAADLGDVEMRAEDQPLIGEHRALLVATDVDCVRRAREPVSVDLGVIPHSL